MNHLVTAQVPEITDDLVPVRVELPGGYSAEVLQSQESAAVSEPATFADDPESQRITSVVQAAADASYRKRTTAAERAFAEKIGLDALTREREAAGFTEERWLQLCSSSRTATPAEFQSFARALHVSPRWLAVGSGTPQTPPPGWDYFGTNIDTLGRLEFSHESDTDLMPLWERPAIEEAA